VRLPGKKLLGSVTVRGRGSGSRGELYLDFEAEVTETGDEPARVRLAGSETTEP
jgi:hypothetical protein